jgi:hypothetical protein
MIESKPKYLHGVFPFAGAGYDKPVLLSEKLAYQVPADKRSQLIYMRAGNSCSELLYLLLMRDGAPMRYFPIGAKSAEHVSLALVEDIFPDTKLELFFAAPSGAQGTLVVDFGLMEI